MDTAAQRRIPRHPLRSDLLFEAMDENDRLHLLHYELQGRTSHKAMPYRELQRRLEAIHQPAQLQQLLLAMFDVTETAVLLDLTRNFENSPGAG